MEHPSVKKMWNKYLRSIGENPENTFLEYSSWHFEITKESAEHLANMVIEEKKKATAASLWVERHDHGKIPMIGEYSVITNFDGVAKCIIQTKAVEIVSFKDVSKEFAQIEGEGDKSLEYWRKVHEIYYTKECERIGKVFTEDMPVICEQFDLVFVG